MKRELKEKLGLTDADFDSHESDLYVINTPAVRAYLKANYDRWSNCTFFVSRVTGKGMIDIPFANDDFWEKVSQRAEK